MIELYEGVPGSGKTYHAIAERLLPWVHKGRRLYVFVRGFYLDRLAAFTGIPLEDLEKQITLLWPDESKVMALHEQVEPGAAVFIDEAQTIFRALQRVNSSLLRWLETHRHYGVDVLMTCQDYRQMTASVTRLVEVTTKFRRLDRLGFRNRYQGFIRGNPEEQEVIRTLIGRYDPAVYQYYASYAQAGVEEQRQPAQVWKNPKVAMGLVGLAAALGLFVARPWVTAGAEPGKQLVQAARTGEKPAPSAPASLPAQASAPSASTPAPKIRVLGVAGYQDGQGRQVWRDLLDSGELLTASQIAGRYGLSVKEIPEEGVMRLLGEGVTYGPSGD
jgi:zona occludens toxin (predicted ATPase)